MSKSLALSGYLPGAEHQNVTELAEGLAAQFNAELSERGEANVTVPVVGILKVAGVTTSAEAGHTVAVKFVALEAPGGKDAGALRDLWRSLHAARNGELVEIEGVDAIMHGDGSARTDDEDGEQGSPRRPVPASFSDTGEAPGRATS